MSTREKSHVALTKCFYCGENDKLVLHTKLGDVSELHGKVLDMEPCPKCAEHMKAGIIVLVFDESKTSDADMRSTPPNPHRTGHYVVVKEQALADLMRGIMSDAKLAESIVADFTKRRVLFMPDVVARNVGLIDRPAAEPT